MPDHLSDRQPDGLSEAVRLALERAAGGPDPRLAEWAKGLLEGDRQEHKQPPQEGRAA